MDFARNLEDLESFLCERHYSWALVGGVALAVYGLMRTTLDLDVVVDAEAQDDLVGFLEAQGFETLHRSAGFSNHLHPRPSRGRIDCVYVRGSTRTQLFAEAETRTGPRGLAVRVPKPEHLIAMKLHAIQNDPSRIFQDLADIRYLAALPGVNHEEIRRQFERHGLIEQYEEIQRTL